VLLVGPLATVAVGCGSDDSSTSSSTTAGGGGASASTTAPGSTGTGTMATTATTSGGGGGSGLACNEMYTDIPMGNCDLLQQDCSGTDWCNVVDDGAGSVTSACVPDAGGLKDVGSACGQTSECRGGLLCVDSVCTPFCCPETHEPCGGGVCDVHLSFNNTVFAMVCSYPQSCNLFAGDCPMGEDCHVASSAQGTTVCDTPSAMVAGEGEECEFRNDCGESMLCWQEDPASTAGKGLCRHFCDVANAGSLQPGVGGCEANRTCTDLMQSTFPGIGLCMAP
jgi:hypothetical protein